MKVKYKMGKLGKYHFMKRYKEISGYLPDTRTATKSNLQAMLKQYGSIYLKPDEGTGGHGIFKLAKVQGKYVLSGRGGSKSFPSFEAVYGAIGKLLAKNKYVAQKTIHMLRNGNRPFDIRVMVQRSRKMTYDVTGIIGRLAKPKNIVTNYHSGGTPLPVASLLKPHLGGAAREAYTNKIKLLGKKASLVLKKSYRKNRAFGVDIAIDNKLKPWVLEVNTQPDMSIFNTLKDKTMYRNILRYARK